MDDSNTGDLADTTEPDDAEDRPRRSRTQVVSMTLALMFLAGAVGYLIRTERPPGPDSAEVGFLYDMIAHHDQARVLADIELKRGGDPKVLVFARETMYLQAFEVGVMTTYLEDWGYAAQDGPDTGMGWMGMEPVRHDQMPGMATEAELARLASLQGAAGDALFLRLLIIHHRGAIHMTGSVPFKVKDRRVRELAARIQRNQSLEIDELLRTGMGMGLLNEAGEVIV